jgi:hypothetical protein
VAAREWPFRWQPRKQRRTCADQRRPCNCGHEQRRRESPSAALVGPEEGVDAGGVDADIFDPSIARAIPQLYTM